MKVISCLCTNVVPQKLYMSLSLSGLGERKKCFFLTSKVRGFLFSDLSGKCKTQIVSSVYCTEKNKR